MSPSIWTQCAGKSRLSPLSLQAWRIVEDQYRSATRKLTASNRDHERLEDLLEGVKPPFPAGPEWKNLHYLLKTPFRYRTPRGSRFRSALDSGVWYGSYTLDTAAAETAFQRLRFLNDTEAALQLEVTLTGFSVSIAAKRGVDLTVPPFDGVEALISSPTTYQHSQPLATDMRQDDTEACRYRSARDPERGDNIAIFRPTAFAQRHVPDSARETFACFGDRHALELRWQRFSGEKIFHFDRSQFEVDGHLPFMKN
jgi:hypothetical protein